VPAKGAFLTEYLLLHRDRSDECVRGGMPADMVSVDIDSARVVMFENKIGGDIGYEPASESNQLARQLDYLIGLLGRGVRDASLPLVSARALFDLGWYRQEFAGVLHHNGRSAKVPDYLVTWEDLFDVMAV
jgi:hypothetical protein